VRLEQPSVRQIRQHPRLKEIRSMKSLWGSKRSRVIGFSKLPALRHPVKGRVALERPHVGRQEAEADRATAVAVIDAVDHGRELLPPLVGGVE
jgi:hypothetical protein